MNLKRRGSSPQQRRHCPTAAKSGPEGRGCPYASQQRSHVWAAFLQKNSAFEIGIGEVSHGHQHVAEKPRQRVISGWWTQAVPWDKTLLAPEDRAAPQAAGAGGQDVGTDLKGLAAPQGRRGGSAFGGASVSLVLVTLTDRGGLQSPLSVVVPTAVDMGVPACP